MEIDEQHVLGTSGSALVLVKDQRAALAAVLVLQEMGFTVDIAVNTEAAMAWIRLARYQWIVCSGGGEQSQTAEFALRLRYNAPHSRILLFGGPDGPLDALDELGVEVLQPPVDVNMLVERFAQPACPSPDPVDDLACCSARAARPIALRERAHASTPVRGRRQSERCERGGDDREC